MARSQKKGPYVHESLWKKLQVMRASGEKRVIKTYKRASMILPEMVSFTIAVHNGRKFIPVYCTESMVGHRLGEFSITRTFKGHSGSKKTK
ncbi:MAG: 30S ribosomal protein S19 [Cyanobacteria bacterium]|mgnify:CR=1 FL=1|jgi:small subunit ribosomal protein S19|nr:30S ribosomal protein S19 [Candidatus Melainabacteria bacterium]MDA0772728.1 30S ribosomal protein S19 [Cyanobacteriota bacterium]MDA1020958.1 30S ribosomal protein S19 [Cyanobacteriota bacterium]